MVRKRESDIYVNSIEPPVYQSASYYFSHSDDVIRGLHERSTPTGRYGRYSNPTWMFVENQISELTHTERTLVFASGMAAHVTTFLTFLKSGDEVLMPAETYRQVSNVLLTVLPKFGIVVHQNSIQDPGAFVAKVRSLRDRLKLVHLEMPSSPHMFVIDLEKVLAELRPETITTLDSSFAPPPNFYPADWGVDLVLFSATKYLAGHGDIMAGSVSGRSDLIEQVRWYRDTTGAVIDGAVASTLKRSIYTLPLRIARMNAMGQALADHLESHSNVARVYYTGSRTHPHHDLAQKYLTGHGGVVTFELGRSEQETASFVERLRVPFMASNFGWPHTLVEQSSFFTYFEYSDAELASIGVDRSTVRIALGYVDELDEIAADIDQALKLSQ